MKTFSAILAAFKNLKRRKMRTFLTVFAVVIGTTLVSAVVSLGVGRQRFVVEGIKGTGELTDINVYLKDESSAKLDGQTITTFESIDGVARVDPVVTLVADDSRLVGSEKSGGRVLVTAVSSTHSDTFNLIAGEGFQGETNVAVAGENFIQEFTKTFPEVSVNKDLELKFGDQDVQLKIVGVAKSENVWGYGIFVPLTLASKVKKMVSYDSVRVKAESVTKVAGISEQIEAQGFEVVTLETLIDQVTKYFRILQLILGSFGIIIIGVAALGIINTMIMSILERTREIGVMRAVGASRRDIIKMFSCEAGAIGFIGGVIGVIFGWLITLGLSSLFNTYLASQNVVMADIDLFATPWWLVVGLILFSTIVGTLAGLYPAFRASRLDPVEALRHE